MSCQNKMNRTQKFTLNAITAAISQVVVMIVGLITPRLMILVYGSEINGLVSSLNQFISYITLVEAGIGGAAIFSLYKPLADDDYSTISRIVSAAKKSYRHAGYIFSSGIFALSLIYGILGSTETLSFELIFPLALLLGMNGSIDFFLMAGYRVLLTADQKNYIISSVGILQTILRTVIIISLAYLRSNVVLLYALALIPVFLKAIFLLIYCKKEYKYIDERAEPDYQSLNKRWDVIYQQILGAIQTGAPTVIATILLNFKLVSVYSVYNMVLSGINGILSVFISGLPAGFGELIAKKENDNLRKSVSEFEVAYYYILSIVYGITFVMIMPFITIYTNGLTDVNYYYPTLAFVIVINGLLYNIKTPQSMLIISAGMYKETRWRVTIQGILLIVSSVLLGNLYGLVGIMLGSCISNAYRTVDLLYFTPKYITHTNPWKAVFRMIRVFMNVALIFAPSLFVEIKTANYFEWVLYAVGFGIYSLIVVTITTFIFDKKDLKALARRIKKMILKGG